VVDCKHPGPIENGRVIIMNDTTTYNSAAEYHCVPHFQRIGPYMRKCLDDAQWSGEQPYCQRKSRLTLYSHNNKEIIRTFFFCSHKCGYKRHQNLRSSCYCWRWLCFIPSHTSCLNLFKTVSISKLTK